MENYSIFVLSGVIYLSPVCFVSDHRT